MNPIFIALLLSTLAGLATTIGSLIAFFIRKPNKQVLSFIMGFSCGVMLLISFVELLQQGIQTNGILVGMGFFLIGMMIMLLIDMKVSHYYEFEEEEYEDEPFEIEFRSDAGRGRCIIARRNGVRARTRRAVDRLQVRSGGLP